MKSIFMIYDEKYSYRDTVPTRNLTLYDLFEFLEYKDYKDCWVKLEEDEHDPNKVIIWSTLNIKRALTLSDFAAPEEDWAYSERYSKYALKRFAEMPAIRISHKNYEALEEQIKGLYTRKPKYLIFQEHDNGYVEMIEKDELSDQDHAAMKREHKIYQNYIKRRDEYEKAHPEKRYGIWRSEADNEFESDFALYDPIDEQGID